MLIRLYEIDYVFVHPDASRNQKGTVFVCEDADINDEDPGLKGLKVEFKKMMDEVYEQFRNNGTISHAMEDYGIHESLLDLEDTPEESLYSGFAKWLVDEYDFEYATPEKIDAHFEIPKDDEEDDSDDDI